MNTGNSRIVWMDATLNSAEAEINLSAENIIVNISVILSLSQALAC